MALDLADYEAYRKGAFGEIPRPFLGYFFLLEDAPESRSPVDESSPHFAVFPEFAQATYADRYNILCQKLIKERLYSCATLLLSAKTNAYTGNYQELSPLTGLRTFVTTLGGHIAAEAAGR